MILLSGSLSVPLGRTVFATIPQDITMATGRLQYRFLQLPKDVYASLEHRYVCVYVCVVFAVERRLVLLKAEPTPQTCDQSSR